MFCSLYCLQLLRRRAGDYSDISLDSKISSILVLAILVQILVILRKIISKIYSGFPSRLILQKAARCKYELVVKRKKGPSSIHMSDGRGV